VGYFRIGFACLIALIVLLIAGIILIYRNVKDSCRNLGIVFLIYGAIALAAVLITKFFVSGPFTNALQTSIQQSANLIQPPDLRNMAGKLLNDVTSPLQTVSLICLTGGILLIAASFVYPRMRMAKIE
jgi:apolipoprotein N-acyltransferase